MIINFLKNNFYEFWIALRYTRLKNRNFISFISLTSIIGITLGVMALIVVLSVMNGFKSELQTKILSVASDIEIVKIGENLKEWRDLKSNLKDIENISAIAPFTNNQAMLSLGKYNRGVIVRGIVPSLEPEVSDLNLKIKEGEFNLIPDKYEILIGVDIARYFGLSVGDKVSLISSQANYSPIGMLPRLKQFKIKGIFEVGMYEYDAGLVLIHLNDAQTLFQMGEYISGLRVKLNDLNQTRKTSSLMSGRFKNSDNLVVTDWTRQHANLFAAIQMEKKVMFVILTLIVAVAAFNIVSTLVMGVTEKTSDIAILRTLGATKKSILFVFMWQGILIGIVGTFLGMLLGITISLNIDTIVPFIEGLFGVQFLSKDIYYISVLPSKLLLSDVIFIGTMSLFLSIIATIYPSIRATRIEPATALKYE
ncbi:lipoprotein-releasing ABC transporter permease subunit [Methylophilaceae bacterium]|nr:lipoprotein-releasing ABC transporter permease subunit [Methylophilaceae bacterium]